MAWFLETFLIDGTQYGPKFVQGVTITACRSVRGNPEGLRDLRKGEVLPQLQVEHGPLFQGKVLQGVFHSKTEGLVITWKNGEQERGCFSRMLFFVNGARACAAQQVEQGIVGGSQKKGAGILRFLQKSRGARQLEKDILEGVLYVPMVAGAVQQKRVQRIGVGVVNLFKGGMHPE